MYFLYPLVDIVIYLLKYIVNGDHPYTWFIKGNGKTKENRTNKLNATIKII